MTSTVKSIKISFKPKQVTKRLLSSLSPRAQEVVTRRYGLGDKTERATLEGIGKKYGITRERVRQIENHAIGLIQKSKEYEKEAEAFEELRKLIADLGGIVAEEDILSYISKDESVQNHIHFMFVIGGQFVKEKENEHFKHRWHIDPVVAEKIHSSLHELYQSLGDDELIPEGEMVNKFLDYVRDVSDEYKNEEVVKRWLGISRKVSKNPLGEWGKMSSPNVNAKGMRDYAFLVIRKHGSPIHFREVAKAISTHFDKKAHVATTHNELIKDKRFVLVGRGLYALREWGYMSGVVKDVIKKVIEKNGPLTREKIIEKVLKERYVKENTIIVNLQNTKYFSKDSEGRYHNVERQ